MYLRLPNPTQAALTYASGVSLLQGGRYGQSIPFFDRAIHLKSGFADAYHMRARAYARGGQPRGSRAIADFNGIHPVSSRAIQRP